MKTAKKKARFGFTIEVETETIRGSKLNVGDALVWGCGSRLVTVTEKSPVDSDGFCLIVLSDGSNALIQKDSEFTRAGIAK